MDGLVRRYRLLRWLLGAIVLVGVPTLLALPAFLDEAPVEVGEPSPRTVVAPTLVRVEDPAATEIARAEASDAVRPVVQFDPQAANAIIEQVRADFAAVSDVRNASDVAAPPPTVDERVDALVPRLPMLEREAIRRLITMESATLRTVADETIDIAQQLARQRIREDELEQVVDETVRVELAVRDLPDGVGQEIVAPIIRQAVRPTVVVDEQATAAQREQAAAEVQPVARTYARGSVIVSAGEEVSPVQLAALERLALAGSDPRWQLLRALAIVVVTGGVVAGYLRTYRPKIWRSNRKLLLLVSLLYGYVALLVLASIAVDGSPIQLYAIPAGSLAMLATILLGAPVGVLATIPVTLVTAFVAPDRPGVIAFTAASMLLSVPLVTSLSSRGDLRRGTVTAAAGYVLLAGVFAAVFGDVADVPGALLAGLGNGSAAAIIVIGGLPFIESAFGVVTATSLIDLADRNHPLLRELEQKALGSYNHSIMVATLVERGCRAIDADPLLGSVAALYHDIGKVRRPYFFVENQFGMPNPHDDLEPEVSAFIIQEHVSDGVEMASEFRLPPEVAEGIATHHGTTIVTYFYLEAVRRARPGERIDESAFRYKGRRPSTKETAVLMLADCCEAASRAAAQNDRNLTRETLEDIVGGLFADRIDDGQLDESPLTFRDLMVLRESFIQTLVGVYHPRIAYPKPAAAEPPDEEHEEAEQREEVEEVEPVPAAEPAAAAGAPRAAARPRETPRPEPATPH